MKLSTNKHGEKGEIHVRLVFQPSIIAKTRKATTTLTTAGRAVTTIGGLPVTAGKGVLHGVTGVFKHLENVHHEEIPSTSPTAASVPLINISEAAQQSNPNLPLVENATATTQPGTLRVTVLDAKDLSHNDVKPYITIRVGDKEVKTKHTQKTHAPEW